MYRLISRHLAVIAFTAALAACGGSSDSPPSANAVTYGVIAPGGGLNVNGIAFSTGNASVVGAGIAPGRVARVAGTVSGRSGEALEVRIDPIYQGNSGPRTPSTLGGTIDVRGQKISVDDSTHIEDSGGTVKTFGQIDSQGRIAVYGFPDDSGTIRASRIDILDGSIDDFELKGFVSNLDAPNKKFSLKASQAPAAAAVPVEMAPAASLPAGIQDGWYVEVRSTAAWTLGNPVIASSVTREDARVGANIEAEVEGIVISGDGNSFVIGGTTVETTGATTFENGVKNEILPGVKVEAEGSLDAAGVLHARKVSLRASVRLTGIATNIVAELGGSSFDLLGFTVHRDAFTKGVAPTAGNAFEVRGRLRANGTTELVAERIDTTSETTKIFVQGPVTSTDPAAHTLEILGISVNVSLAAAAIPSGLQNVDDAPVTEAAFFALAKPGTVVKARGADAGALSGGTLTAEEASIEGDR
jgi:hypothetical protein